MKKAIIAVLALAVVAVGVIFAIGQRSGDGKNHGFGKRGGHHRGMGMEFRGLDLNEDQKAKIKEIWESAKSNSQGLREAMKANHQKIQELTAGGAFDEAAVTAAANEQAAVAAKLIVERQRVRSQIFELLTDEQKAKFAEIKEKRGGRGKHGRGPKAAEVGE